MTLAPLRPLGPPDTAVGLTVGAEEEFHLVDPDTGATASCPELLDVAGAGRCGAHVQAELQSCQLETATDVCVTLADLRGQLAMARGEAAAAAASAGAALLGSAMHPFSSWREVELTDRPRYRRLESRFGFLTNQQVICGCHVHVSVPDLDTAVAVMAHARPWLPLLIALTGSSPFQDGRDTGFDSWRIESWQRWPHAGPPPRLSCAAEYQEAVAELVAAGIIDDASNLYWDVRPSLRYPTVEFRVADACPNLEDTLMYAALVRSLARTVAVQAERGMPAPGDARRNAAGRALARCPLRPAGPVGRSRSRHPGDRAGRGPPAPASAGAGSRTAR
jgi:carboxylate-amine ligase